MSYESRKIKDYAISNKGDILLIFDDSSHTIITDKLFTEIILETNKKLNKTEKLIIPYKEG